jgi:hypothetical protein
LRLEAQQQANLVRLNRPQAFKVKPLLKLLVYKLMLPPALLNYRPHQPAKPPQSNNKLHSNRLTKRGAPLRRNEHFFSPTKNRVLTRLRVFKPVLAQAVSLPAPLRWISFKPILATPSDCPKARRRLSVRLRPVAV